MAIAPVDAARPPHRRPARALPGRSVVVIHPVHQHAYESAVAADQAGLLLAFATGVYVRPSVAASARALGAVSPAAARAAVPLSRRRHPELDDRRVRRFSAGPWLAIGRQRLLRRPAPLFEARWLDGFDRRTTRWIRRTRPAVVHTFDYRTPRTLLAARELGLRTVLDVTIDHEAACPWLIGDPVCPHLARLTAERQAADILLAGSTGVAAGLVRAGVDPERVRVVPYAADPGMFRPSPDRRREVLMVGQLTRRKGLDLLLAAWAELAAPDWTLHLIGVPDADGAALLVAAPESVRHTTHLPRAEMAERMAGAAVFVLASRAEGSALVVYEAMAAGLAVVTTPQAGSVITSGYDGLVVDPEVPDLLAALRSLTGDDDRRAALGAAARATITGGYTWQHYRRRLAAVYAELLDR